MKSAVTISRYWNNPQIFVKVTDESISLSIDFEDFIKALSTEIGSVTWVFTDKKFKDKFDKAVLLTLEKVKEESKKVL